MKTFIFIAMFLTIGIATAQTRTEKYNSLMERYEYFDSKGNLVGYKKYNSLLEQWEYNEVEKRKTRDYGSYQKPINTDLVRQVMAEKQKRYDIEQDRRRQIQEQNLKIYEKNEAAVKSNMRSMGERIGEAYSGSENLERAHEYYSKFLSERWEQFESSDGLIYLGKYETAKRLIELLQEAFISTLKNVPKETFQSYQTAVGISYPITPKLKDSPELFGDIILELPRNSTVTVLGIPNDSYYKVKVKGQEGYLSKIFIENDYEEYLERKENGTYKVYPHFKPYKTTFFTALGKPKLRSSPEIGGDVIYESPVSSEVTVVDKQNDVYYKVIVDGHEGYISKAFLRSPSEKSSATNSTANSPKKSNVKSKVDLSFVENFQGEYKFREMVSSEPLFTLLQELLGKAQMEKFLENIEVQSSIEISDNQLMVSACQAHSCSLLESALYINLDKNLVFVGLLDRDQVHIKTNGSKEMVRQLGDFPPMFKQWTNDAYKWAGFNQN